MENKLKNKLLIKALQKKSKTVITAQGNSMFPLIVNNQKVQIIGKKFKQIKVSDIVVYKLKDKIITHQCLFKTKRYLVCFGLNNKFIDPPIYPKQILGVINQPNYWQIINLVYRSELKKIQTLLPKTKFLVLKGSLWQKNLYGYHTNFPLSDSDLLIRKTDYPKLKQTLIDLGYQTKSGFHINPNRYDGDIPQVGEISFYKKIKGIYINFDIHLQAVRSALHRFNCRPISKKNMNNLTILLWQTAKLDHKTNIYFLENEYLLLYLCLNLIFHHGLRNIKMLSYIATCIDRQKVNWSNFYQLSKDYQVANYVYSPLLYSALFFGIKIPKLSQYKPSFIKKLLLKLFINKHLVFYPLNCGRSFPNWLNSRLIFFIRLILNA